MKRLSLACLTLVSAFGCGRTDLGLVTSGAEDTGSIDVVDDGGGGPADSRGSFGGGRGVPMDPSERRLPGSLPLSHELSDAAVERGEFRGGGHGLAPRCLLPWLLLAPDASALRSRRHEPALGSLVDRDRSRREDPALGKIFQPGFRGMADPLGVMAGAVCLTRQRTRLLEKGRGNARHLAIPGEFTAKIYR